jgi:hypothetical protein
MTGTLLPVHVPRRDDAEPRAGLPQRERNVQLPAGVRLAEGVHPRLGGAVRDVIDQQQRLVQAAPTTRATNL